MAAATASNGTWLRPAAPSQPTDKSPITYPERPIRPLPKRRIRSRLSEEQADNIVFPPVVSASSPPFESPQSHVDRGFGTSQFTGHLSPFPDEQDRDHDHFCDCGEPHSPGDSEDGDDEEEPDRLPSGQRYSWPGRTMKYPRRYESRAPTQLKSPPLNSSTSSADGYESFENTNNKKKRKIPVSGALGGQALSSDVAGMSIPTQSVNVDDETESFAQPSTGSGIGISGPGRGRYSRSTVRPLNERRPLAYTVDAINALAGSLQASYSDRGIISTAIANAAESSQTPAPKGQENVSLLQRQKSAATPPQSFTFEYKSASSDKFASARPNLPPPPLPKPPAALKQSAGPGGKLSPSNSIVQGQQTNRSQTTQQQTPTNQPNSKPSKPRRPGQALRMAALRRKEQQRYENYYNPPKPEDTWVCEFCEYESIFGTEPTALIRQYELKERRERREREKNRKRLEQAKAKGRKGKKGKSSQKHGASNAASGGTSQNQRYDPRYDGPHDGDSQAEEFFDDEYEDSLQGPSPPDQEPAAYASHEYPPPPLIEPVEEVSPLEAVASAP